MSKKDSSNVSSNEGKSALRGLSKYAAKKLAQAQALKNEAAPSKEQDSPAKRPPRVFTVMRDGSTVPGSDFLSREEGVGTGQTNKTVGTIQRRKGGKRKRIDLRKLDPATLSAEQKEELRIQLVRDKRRKEKEKVKKARNVAREKRKIAIAEGRAEEVVTETGRTIRYKPKVVNTMGIETRERIPDMKDPEEQEALLMPHNRRDQFLFAPIERRMAPLGKNDFIVKYLDKWAQENDPQGLFSRLIDTVKYVRAHKNGIAYIGLPAFFMFLDGKDKRAIVDEYAFTFKRFIKRREITDFIASMEGPALKWMERRHELEKSYAFVYFDTYPIRIKLGKRKVNVEQTLFIIGVTLDGRKDLLGVLPDYRHTRATVSLWEMVLGRFKELGCRNICFVVASTKCRYLDRAVKTLFPEATMQYNLLDLLQLDSYKLKQEYRKQFMHEAKEICNSEDFPQAQRLVQRIRENFEERMEGPEGILQGNMEFVRNLMLLSGDERNLLSTTKIVANAAATLMGKKAELDFFSDHAEMLNYLFYRYVLVVKNQWLVRQDYAITNVFFSKVFSKLRRMDIPGGKLLNELLSAQHQDFMARHFGQFGSGPVFSLNPNKKRISLAGELNDKVASSNDAWSSSQEDDPLASSKKQSKKGPSTESVKEKQQAELIKTYQQEEVLNSLSTMRANESGNEIDAITKANAASEIFNQAPSFIKDSPESTNLEMRENLEEMRLALNRDLIFNGPIDPSLTPAFSSRDSVLNYGYAFDNDENMHSRPAMSLTLDKSSQNAIEKLGNGVFARGINANGQAGAAGAISSEGAAGAASITLTGAGTLSIHQGAEAASFHEGQVPGINAGNLSLDHSGDDLNAINAAGHAKLDVSNASGNAHNAKSIEAYDENANLKAPLEIRHSSYQSQGKTHRDRATIAMDRSNYRLSGFPHDFTAYGDMAMVNGVLLNSETARLATDLASSAYNYLAIAKDDIPKVPYARVDESENAANAANAESAVNDTMSDASAANAVNAADTNGQSSLLDGASLSLNQAPLDIKNASEDDGSEKPARRLFHDVSFEGSGSFRHEWEKDAIAYYGALPGQDTNEVAEQRAVQSVHSKSLFRDSGNRGMMTEYHKYEVNDADGTRLNPGLSVVDTKEHSGLDVSSNIQTANAVLGMLKPSISQALKEDRLLLKRAERYAMLSCLGPFFSFKQINNVIHQVTPIFRQAMQTKLNYYKEMDKVKAQEAKQKLKEKDHQRYLKRVAARAFVEQNRKNHTASKIHDLIPIQDISMLNFAPQIKADNPFNFSTKPVIDIYNEDRLTNFNPMLVKMNFGRAKNAGLSTKLRVAPSLLKVLMKEGAKIPGERKSLQLKKGIGHKDFAARKDFDVENKEKGLSSIRVDPSLVADSKNQHKGTAAQAMKAAQAAGTAAKAPAKRGRKPKDAPVESKDLKLQDATHTKAKDSTQAPDTSGLNIQKPEDFNGAVPAEEIRTELAKRLVVIPGVKTQKPE